MIIHIIISFDQNILLIFLCESWIHGQAKTSVLCLLYRPETVHCSKKKSYNSEITKVIMRGKLFQKSSHFVYCSILSLGGKVNTRRMSQPDMDMEHWCIYFVFKFHPARTGFNMYAEYTRPQLTFLALVPWK